MSAINAKINIGCPLKEAKAHILDYFSQKLGTSDGIRLMIEEADQEQKKSNILYTWDFAFNATGQNFQGTIAIDCNVSDAYVVLSIEEIISERESNKSARYQKQSDRRRASAFFRELLIDVRSSIESRQTATKKFGRLVTIRGEYSLAVPSIRASIAAPFPQTSLGSMNVG